MDFNNFNNYITLTNEELPPKDFKYFEVKKSEIQIKIPSEDFIFQNISDFYIESNCIILESFKTNKGKNLKEELLLGFITNIKIELKEILEYNSFNSEVKMFFNEDFIGESILTLTPIDYNIKPYFYLNFAYVFKENSDYLNLSLVYTLYLL